MYLKIFICISMCSEKDGATCHTAKQTMKLLSQIFGNRIISRSSAFGRPPQLPDLTAPDFFLWGYLKDWVYINKPRTIIKLKENIREEIKALTSKSLTAIMKHTMERARLCEAAKERHLNDVVFRSKCKYIS